MTRYESFMGAPMILILKSPQAERERLFVQGALFSNRIIFE